MTEFPRDAILVVVETQASGELEKAAPGLFGAAAAAGTPIALVLAAPGTGSAAAAEAAALGAAHVLIAETPDPPRSACRALTRLPPLWSRCSRTQS